MRSALATFFSEASNFIVNQKFFIIFEQIVFKVVPGRLVPFLSSRLAGLVSLSVLRACGTVPSLGRGPFLGPGSCVEYVTQSSWLWETLIFILFVPPSEYMGYFSVIFIHYIKTRREDKSPG